MNLLFKYFHFVSNNFEKDGFVVLYNTGCIKSGIIRGGVSESTVTKIIWMEQPVLYNWIHIDISKY